ncbi:MAG: phosphatase PAP2 family protein [Bacteroidia bacterium]
MERLAAFISGFFHPSLLVVYLALMAFWLQPIELLYYPPTLVLMILAEVFLIGSLLPTLAVALLVRLKLVGTFKIEERSQRHLPYLIQALCLAVLVFIFRSMQLANLLYMSVTGAMLAVLFAWFINKHWKISAHAVGMGGLVGFVWSMQYTAQREVFWPILICLIFAGLTGSARVALKAHSPIQVFAGFGLGLLCMIFSLFPYWLKI